jgi:hypothetical protein
MKKNLCISFSGGETSAYMAQWLWQHKKNEYDMKFVFANTGQENEETYEFIEKCSSHFGFNVVWIEAVTNPKHGVGQSFRVVDFDSASRDGLPFEAVIAKHGIPNVSTPHCTRDLKERPIKKYIKSIGWKKYQIAIGIRVDEIDRINLTEGNLIYPLVSMIPMTKPKINFWWSQQPFRLDLKGYQGNCKWCWKKSDRKLYTIANENPEAFSFPIKMEEKYGDYIPETRLSRLKDRGEEVPDRTWFFRGNRSSKDILSAAKKTSIKALDDSTHTSFQLGLFDEDLVGGESCEVFSDCRS